MDYILVHLKGVHCSQRAVKLSMLSPDDRDEVLDEAAKAVGSDGTMLQLKRKEWKLGALHMIKAVTVEPVVGDPNREDVKWRKVTPAILDDEYNKLFTSKDHALLISAFRMYHEVNDEEISAIVGKAQTVSED